jgi:hypothetical protein
MNSNSLSTDEPDLLHVIALSPKSLHAIRVELGISTQDGNSLGKCLGNEESVEWVFVTAEYNDEERESAVIPNPHNARIVTTVAIELEPGWLFFKGRWTRHGRFVVEWS